MDINSENFEYFSKTIKERENSIIENLFEPKNSNIVKYEYFNENNNKLFEKRLSNQVVKLNLTHNKKRILISNVEEHLMLFVPWQVFMFSIVL